MTKLRRRAALAAIALPLIAVGCGAASHSHFDDVFAESKAYVEAHPFTPDCGNTAAGNAKGNEVADALRYTGHDRDIAIGRVWDYIHPRCTQTP
jgi:hypothetical protein